MCGIAGFVRENGSSSERDGRAVRAMLQPIAHRGPDENGVYVGDRVAFGHLRLAIVDLVGGHQPRIDPGTGDALVFNGEIYGFAGLAAELRQAGAELIDHSDTEVLFRLLQRDGVDATLERIDGMFAFAFFEARTGTLHLARDRFGEKPLYYAETPVGLVFGSEPRAVLAHPACSDLGVDPGAVATFLAFEYLPGGRSLRRSLKKLPPGHALAFHGGRASLRCYWQPDPDESGAARKSETEAARLDRLDALFEQTMRDRLIADVPVGVFLSGGIDSSLVAALTARFAPGLTAMTVAVPGDSFDEAPVATTLARQLGLAHRIIPMDDAALLAAFGRIESKMDEPIADASLLATSVLCSAARESVTVALGGDGADELFTGYISFKANRGAGALAMLPGSLGRLVRSTLSRLPKGSGYMSADFLLRQLSQGFGIDPARQWAACMAPFAPEELAALWQDDARALAAREADDPIAERLALRGARPWSTAELIHLFATTYLPEDILLKVERASMYASLEVRAPFLGRAFAEYAMSLPSDDKLRGLSTKYLFKKLALRHIPREIVERKKHGFAVPMARLLRGPLKEQVGAALLDAGSPLNEWFRPAVIETLWQQHQSGTRDHRKKLWALYSLAISVRNTAPVRQDAAVAA